MGVETKPALALKELYVGTAYGQAGRAVTIGSGATSQGLVSPNDLYVTGELEVDGETFIDGTFRMNGTANVITTGYLCWGGLSTSSRTQLRVSGSFDQMVLGVGSDLGRQLVIADAGSASSDFDHATPTNPTLFIHSVTDPDSANDEWVSIKHETANGEITTGKGDLFLNPNSGVVKFGTHSAIAAETLSGYITITDAAGTPRKVGVIS